jgi:two-component system NtrC family sensor kinase
MSINISNQLSFLKDLTTKKPRYSLSVKLITAIGILVLIGGSIFWYMIIIKGERELLNNTIRYTESYSEIIEKSIFKKMLARRVEDIQQTIEVIGTSENTIDINLYNTKGEIRFSSNKSNVGKKLDRETTICKICHTDPSRPHETLVKKDGMKPHWKILKDKSNRRVLKVGHPILNRKTCYTAPCHFHPPDKKVLGILEIDYSLDPIDKTLRGQRQKTILFVVIFTLFGSIALFIILWKIIINPLQLIANGMKDVSRGNLDHEIKINTKDEMGMLANTFNLMIGELKTSREKLENWAHELEAEVQRKAEEIRQGQEQLIHTEKLASLGRMAAGVAHEINSPLTGIVTFAHLMLKRVPPENREDREDLEVIIEQAERCSKIIKGLLGFSRALPTEKTDLDVNNSIIHTVEIIRNQAKFHNIKITTDLAENLPPIKGDPSQLQQIYMNLLINAADAMNDRGEIRISTRRIRSDDREFIEIEFTDSGPGIPEEHMNRLFEPFFTTKPVGKGTGLVWQSATVS